MKKIFTIFLILFAVSSIAHAHGGRTDSCGGHNDRKRGGYHIHNQEKYNSCNSSTENVDTKKSNHSLNKQKEDKEDNKSNHSQNNMNKNAEEKN